MVVLFGFKAARQTLLGKGNRVCALSLQDNRVLSVEGGPPFSS
jgi:hypothetical protein